MISSKISKSNLVILRIILRIFQIYQFQANDSEFHKSWCAIIPSWGSEGWIFTARKAPCDTSSIYEKPLNNCSFDPVVTHNQREWNLTLGNERFYILLEDNSTRNDWVTHMRQGIKSKLLFSFEYRRYYIVDIFNFLAIFFDIKNIILP